MFLLQVDKEECLSTQGHGDKGYESSTAKNNFSTSWSKSTFNKRGRGHTGIEVLRTGNPVAESYRNGLNVGSLPGFGQSLDSSV